MPKLSAKWIITAANGVIPIILTKFAHYTSINIYISQQNIIL